MLHIKPERCTDATPRTQLKVDLYCKLAQTLIRLQQLLQTETHPLCKHDVMFNSSDGEEDVSVDYTWSPCLRSTHEETLLYSWLIITLQFPTLGQVLP